MTRVNLLPWRDIRRKEQDRELLIAASGAWAVMALIVLYAHMHVHALVSNQQRRNDFLQQQIAVVNGEIKQIGNIKKQRADLIARMQVIEKLEQRRTGMVHELDGLVRTLPPGLYLTALSQNGKTFTLSGVAQSNARISSFLRRLHRSRWFANPNLEVITVMRQNGARVSQFTLQVTEADKPAAAAKTAATTTAGAPS